MFILLSGSFPFNGVGEKIYDVISTGDYTVCHELDYATLNTFQSNKNDESSVPFKIVFQLFTRTYENCHAALSVLQNFFCCRAQSVLTAACSTAKHSNTYSQTDPPPPPQGYLKHLTPSAMLI